jgi:hypothetical protein
LPAADTGQPGIEDHALIGDCHGAALVSRGGAIDWCSHLRLDGDPIFFRLLDAEEGGPRTIKLARLRRAGSFAGCAASRGAVALIGRCAPDGSRFSTVPPALRGTGC